MTTASPALKTRRRIYIGNLFRFRSMYQGLFIGILLALLFSWTGSVGATIGFVVGYVLIMWYWLGVQMVCRNCVSRLRAVRTQGNQMHCQKCGQPTDKALASKG